MREAATRAVGLMRRWRVQIGAVGLGLLAGLTFSLAQETAYTADSYLVVIAQNGNDGQAADFAQAYARIVGQPAILAMAVNGAAPPLSIGGLRRTVQASASPDAPLLRLRASAPTSDLAAEQSNAVAHALITYANAHTGETRVRLASFATAFPPDSPSSPSPALAAAVGSAGGLVAGVLVRLALPLPLRRRPATERRRA
jgi:capsular polysaccharide biosynthesis protein